jgi:hypothetical protein
MGADAVPVCQHHTGLEEGSVLGCRGEGLPGVCKALGAIPSTCPSKSGGFWSQL